MATNISVEKILFLEGQEKMKEDIEKKLKQGEWLYVSMVCILLCFFLFFFFCRGEDGRGTERETSLGLSE